jgi:hypothetical protein
VHMGYSVWSRRKPGLWLHSGPSGPRVGSYISTVLMICRDKLVVESATA